MCICGTWHSDGEFRFTDGSLYRFDKWVGGLKDEATVKNDCREFYKGRRDLFLVPLVNGVADYGGGRQIKMGTINGMGDHIGGISFVIGPEHIGMTIMQFATLEAKREQGGETSPTQLNVMSNVIRLGGRAGVIRSVQDAERILYGPMDQLPVHLAKENL